MAAMAVTLTWPWRSRLSIISAKLDPKAAPRASAPRATPHTIAKGTRICPAASAATPTTKERYTHRATAEAPMAKRRENSLPASKG